MTTFEWLALGAFLISGLTALGTFYIARKQGTLSRRQRDLEDHWLEYRHELVTAGREHAQTAEIKLVCYTNDRLTIENVGGAEARDVSVESRCPDGRRSAITAGSLLPIDRLAGGGTASVRLSLTMDCYFPLPATVTWTNPDGSKSEETVALRPA